MFRCVGVGGRPLVSVDMCWLVAVVHACAVLIGACARGPLLLVGWCLCLRLCDLWLFVCWLVNVYGPLVGCASGCVSVCVCVCVGMVCCAECVGVCVCVCVA